MMTMKEACQYMRATRKTRNHEHRIEVRRKHGSAGFIQSFTDKERSQIKVTGKTTFSKGKSAAYNSIWRHHDLPKITKES